MKKSVLAFDFGASSGRAMLADLDGEKITLTEVHRFSNDPVELRGVFYWDTLRLFHEIKQGILKAKLAGGFSSIGINTWGVDFGLLGSDGQLIESGVNYRDSRTNGMLKASEKYISNEELYRLTGNQLMEINTAFQLLSLKEHRPNILVQAETMLLTPDLFNYFLTGEKVTEISIASTTQLFDFVKSDWNWEVIKKLGLPEKIFTKIVKSGSVVGLLDKKLCEELGVEQVPVIAVCGHDTQDAVAAAPAEDEDFIFLSCGTWSLFGTELKAPVINETTRRLNLTNEAGLGGSVDLLNNITGLWLIQESRRQWAREGCEITFAQLESQASEAGRFRAFIDPDHQVFAPAGNIPERIRNFCRKTEQQIPESKGEIVRCIYDSLAMKYRYSLELIKEVTGKIYPSVNIVGGGARDSSLCQTTANVCGIKVKAGPVEATVLGNAAVQFIAGGEIKDISTARKIIGNSEEIKTFLPEKDMENIAPHYEEFLNIMEKSKTF